MNALGVLVEQEIEMFELASKSRQRESVVFEVVRESVPDRRTSMTDWVYIGDSHRRRRSVNFRGARHFCPKNMYEKLRKCPNFT